MSSCIKFSGEYCRRNLFNGFEHERKNLEDIYLNNIHNVKLRHNYFSITRSAFIAYISLGDCFCLVNNLCNFVLLVLAQAMLPYTQQLFYEQLALEWQIAKQVSGLNPLSLSNNKNYK